MSKQGEQPNDTMLGLLNPWKIELLIFGLSFPSAQQLLLLSPIKTVEVKREQKC